MYALEYYKSIKKPEALLRVGQSVAISTYRGTRVPGRIVKMARVWMTVAYIDSARNFISKTEEFHMETLRCKTSSDHIIAPEVLEFEGTVARAREVLAKYSVGIEDYQRRNDPQLLFYLADCLNDFYGPEEVKAEESSGND